MNEQSLTSGKLFTMGEIVQILNVPKYRLIYLFDSRKLKAEEFLKMPNGHIIYRESDIQKIREVLFEGQAK